jgi:hypothetical protein
MAEYFQNELLLKDEALNKLIKESKTFEKTFRPIKSSRMEANESITKDELRDRITQFEKEFLILSNEFNEKIFRGVKH